MFLHGRACSIAVDICCLQEDFGAAAGDDDDDDDDEEEVCTHSLRKSVVLLGPLKNVRVS
jgi:hypothetical protein